MSVQPSKKPASSLPANVSRIILLVLTLILAFAMLVAPDLLNEQTQKVHVGEVSTQEILAPYSVSFESRAFTEAARDSAASAAPAVYLPPDPAIARSQLEKLENSFYYITTVRGDNFSSEDQKIQDLKSLDLLQLSDGEYEDLLQLSDQDFQAIRAESTRVLEIVLRESIRNNQLGTVRSNLPATIDFAFKNDQTKLIVSIISPFIVPTSLYSEEQTEAAREAARSAVMPINRQIMAGEVLLRRGQIVSEGDLEALTIFGLGEPTDRGKLFLSSGLMIALVGALIFAYHFRRNHPIFNNIKSLSLVALFFLAFLAIGRFMVMGRTIVPYLFPVAAFGLTISLVFNFEFGFFTTFLLVTLTVFGYPRSAELALYYLVPTITGMLVLGKGRRVSTFFLTGGIAALLSAAIILTFRFGDRNTDLIGMLTLLAAAAANGLLSGTFALLLQNIFSLVLDEPTALQLMDISRPDHPLLQQILTSAPGTYQHSLQVSNLAEQAAEKIGADRLLVRVGALYHDAGKSENPSFFIENQSREDLNSHDNVDPSATAATIIRHVTDGVALAKRHRLPSRIIDFIKEHHGTNITRYQYNLALKVAENPDEVDVEAFTYPGPAPRSKETALLMLADGTEASARSNAPKTDNEIKTVINNVFDAVQNANQLDDTDLTLRDLQTIKQSFFDTLKQSYHPRIKYPEEPKRLAKPDEPVNQLP